MSGPISDPISKVIRQHLINEGIATAGGTWPVWIANQADSPDDSLSVFDTAPLPQGRFMSGETQEHYGIQILIRSATYSPGWIKAKAIADHFDTVSLSTVTVGANNYLLQSVKVAGAPISLGRDRSGKSDRYLFSLNLTTSLSQL